MKLEQARTFALSLPETVEQPHFDMSSFRVKGKIFCTVPAEGKTLHVFVGDDETLAAVADDPAAYEELWWGKKRSGVRVHLAGTRELSSGGRAEAGEASASADGELVEEAWRVRAPATLVARYDAG